jgi:propionyl-CoA synthetase
MRIMNRYRDLYQERLNDPTALWSQAAREVTWTRPTKQTLDDSRPPFYRWFPHAELSTCVNALDRHADAGRGDQAALIYDSPVTATQHGPCRRRRWRAGTDARTHHTGSPWDLGDYRHGDHPMPHSLAASMTELGQSGDFLHVGVGYGDERRTP